MGFQKNPDSLETEIEMLILFGVITVGLIMNCTLDFGFYL